MQFYDRILKDAWCVESSSHFLIFFFYECNFLLVSALWINCVSRFSDCNKRQNLWETFIFLLFGATCHHWNFVVTPPSPNSVFLCNIWKWQQYVVKDGIETWKLILTPNFSSFWNAFIACYCLNTNGGPKMWFRYHESIYYIT